TYDDQNRMVGFSKTGTTASYGYNGKGERVRKTVNGTITRFRFGPSGALLGEYDQSGQAIREYLYLEGQPVVQLQGPVPAQVSYLHTDHLGAVVKATDGAGSVVWDSDRRPFGERALIVAQVVMPLGFPGQYYDQETGNYYNYFRDYDPATGRYLQSDPIGLEGGVNTYVYVGSNPLQYFDFFGLKRVVVYEVRKGVWQMWWTQAIGGCSDKVGGCADFHERYRLVWTAEVGDSCKLAKTNTDIINGPNEYFLTHMQWYQATHTEYIYESSDKCEDCNPTDYRYEVTETPFPHPGHEDL
ncbi:MAG: RHS repeat-associated core domain-containing protein, partial [Candidatus Thiodiazotropha lotti]